MTSWTRRRQNTRTEHWDTRACKFVLFTGGYQPSNKSLRNSKTAAPFHCPTLSGINENSQPQTIEPAVAEPHSRKQFFFHLLCVLYCVLFCSTNIILHPHPTAQLHQVIIWASLEYNARIAIQYIVKKRLYTPQSCHLQQSQSLH